MGGKKPTGKNFVVGSSRLSTRKGTAATKSGSESAGATRTPNQLTLQLANTRRLVLGKLNVGDALRIDLMSSPMIVSTLLGAIVGEIPEAATAKVLELGRKRAVVVKLEVDSGSCAVQI